MLNKPQGYLTAVSSAEGYKTVMDLVEAESARRKHIYPVGRLDLMSEGLLLLTNDGDFSYKITHPKFNIVKSYIVNIKGEFSEDLFKRIKKGVSVEGAGLLKAKDIKIAGKNPGKFQLLIGLSHGKNREIRRLLEFFNLKVISLKRIRIGGLELGDLPSGHYRILTKRTADLAFKQ